MARRPPPTARPTRPNHSSEEKRQDIVRLRRRIAELENFDPLQVTSRFSDPTVLSLQTSIASTLSNVFGDGTTEYNRYSSATSLDHGSIIMSAGPWDRGHRDEVAEARKYLIEGKASALALLQQAVRALEEEIEFELPSAEDTGTDAVPREHSRKVFVVYGHDEGAREAVARFVERLGFEAVILHERANRGRTVIEKVEAHGDVAFAIVLLTPDDEGCAKGGVAEPRARQNVLLELGYFIGRLGRENVCALKRGQVEIPSDFAGVVWEDMDETGGWKQALGRELEAAGHQIDWNLVMR